MPKVEVFYWAAITVSQTLGTALGDWVADSGLGYEESRSRKSAQDDKWSFCLTAGTLCPSYQERP